MSTSPSLDDLLACNGVSDFIIARTAFSDLERADAMARQAAAIMQQAVADLRAIGIFGITPLLSPGASDTTGATDEEDQKGFRKNKVSGIPHARVFEMVLRRDGRPMHQAEIAEEAMMMGLEFDAECKTPIAERVRSFLIRCDRFENLGGSIWWLARVPVPPNHSQVECDQGFVLLQARDA